MFRRGELLTKKDLVRFAEECSKEFTSVDCSEEFFFGSDELGLDFLRMEIQVQ